MTNESLFFGTGDETRDWLDVSDAAALLVMAAEDAATDCPMIVSIVLPIPAAVTNQ